MDFDKDEFIRRLRRGNETWEGGDNEWPLLVVTADDAPESLDKVMTLNYPDVIDLLIEELRKS